jgi:hypothetical protein
VGGSCREQRAESREQSAESREQSRESDLVAEAAAILQLVIVNIFKTTPLAFHDRHGLLQVREVHTHAFERNL